MTKTLTNKNAKKKVSTAIKHLSNVQFKIKKSGPRATGLWGHAIKIETTKGTAVYNPGFDMWRWCEKTGFPKPKNEEEKNKIEKLADFRLFILKRELKNFVNDIIGILVAERAILFYLGVAMGVILGFSAYHYFF